MILRPLYMFKHFSKEKKTASHFSKCPKTTRLHSSDKDLKVASLRSDQTSDFKMGDRCSCFPPAVNIVFFVFFFFYMTMNLNHTVIIVTMMMKITEQERRSHFNPNHVRSPTLTKSLLCLNLQPTVICNEERHIQMF